VYDLSKRTALYVNYAQLSNKVGFANNVGSAAASAGGVKSSGFDVGVRHSF
jgi:predicted porin